MKKNSIEIFISRICIYCWIEKFPRILNISYSFRSEIFNMFYGFGSRFDKDTHSIPCFTWRMELVASQFPMLLCCWEWHIVSDETWWKLTVLLRISMGSHKVLPPLIVLEDCMHFSLGIKNIGVRMK